MVTATVDEITKAQNLFDRIKPVRGSNGQRITIPFVRWTDATQREFLKMVRSGGIW